MFILSFICPHIYVVEFTSASASKVKLKNLFQKLEFLKF